MGCFIYIQTRPLELSVLILFLIVMLFITRARRIAAYEDRVEILSDHMIFTPRVDGVFYYCDIEKVECKNDQIREKIFMYIILFIVSLLGRNHGTKPSNALNIFFKDETALSVKLHSDGSDIEIAEEIINKQISKQVR